MIQPDLFPGQRRKAPAALEIATHCAIAGLLRAALKPGWLWWHTPNGEKRDKAAAGRLKAMGVLPGVSDFLLLSPPLGRLHALELKRRGLHPTDDQERFMDAVRAAGGEAVWVDSFEGALHVLKTWQAIRVST